MSHAPGHSQPQCQLTSAGKGDFENLVDDGCVAKAVDHVYSIFLLELVYRDVYDVCSKFNVFRYLIVLLLR